MKTYRETLRRAGRTFLQAALGYIITNVTLVTMGYENAEEVKAALVGLFTAALAAGLAAVMNLPQKAKEAEG